MREEKKISCIMPTTAERRPFVEKAIEYFLRQDYENKELVIVDSGDGWSELGDIVPRQSNIQYVYLDTMSSGVDLTIGAKRNLACSLASGEIIAHFDDDDYRSERSLTHLAQPLLDKQAYMSGYRMGAVYDISTGNAYIVSDDLHKKMFFGNVHGGTIMYYKWLWERRPYPNVNIGEDAQFMHVMDEDAIEQVPNSNDFVYIRHGSNAWSFVPGEHITSDGWQRVEVEGIMPVKDVRFYKQFREKVTSNAK